MRPFNLEQTENALDLLSIVLDCPARNKHTEARAKCDQWIADMEGECNELYCWGELLKDRNYYPNYYPEWRVK